MSAPATPRPSGAPGPSGASRAEPVPGASRLRPTETVIARADPANPTHRERLLEALAESIREHGFRGTTVADVVRRARTSRRTFYEHFADREECFVALFDAMNTVLSARIAAALEPDASWERQVDLAVGAYIDEVVAEPELIVACVREIPAMGELGIKCQLEEVERFADLLMALVAVVGESDPQVTPIQRSTAIMLTGGLRELIAHASYTDLDPDGLKLTASSVIKSVLDPAHRQWGPAGADSPS